jgi:nitrogen fixation NifU-like protein
MCGDTITVHLKLSPERRIEDAAFEGKGCAISVASASMMTEILKGKTEEEAKRLFDSFHAMCTSSDADAPDVEDDEAFESLQVLAGVRQFPVRVKCATLAWHTMVAAMNGQAEASSE